MKRFLVVGALVAGAVLAGCGINPLTIENPPPPYVPPVPVPLLQMDVTLQANDQSGQPMTFSSVHWALIQSVDAVAQLSNGFRFLSQVSQDNSGIVASVFFSGMPNCPIELEPTVAYQISPQAQRILTLSLTAFSQTAGKDVWSNFDSTKQGPQTFEACGVTFTVQFSITGAQN